MMAVLTLKGGKMMKHAIVFILAMLITLIIGMSPGGNVLASGPVKITQISVCESILDREPVDEGKIFPRDVGELYCFTRVYCSEPTQIKHIWYHNGEVAFSKSLNIGVSNGWRTRSMKSIYPHLTGNWTVAVEAMDGTSLDSIEFVIK